MKRIWSLILVVALLSLILVACSGAAPTTEQAPAAAPAEEEATAPAEEEAVVEEVEEEAAAPAEEEAAAPAEEEAAPAATGLAAVCPSPVVIQTDWFPEAEYGATYNLIGDDYVVDTEKKSVRGSLMASGQDTGIDVEVRTGGPAIGFQQPIQQMYVETDITLGFVSTNEAVFGAEDTPTLTVVAPLEKNPQIIMWDPETYPDVETIADLGKTGATIQVFAGGTFIDVFVNEGIVSADQIDPSYDGSPARWVAENGAVAQQGFASAEPYVYENEIEEWGKPVAYQLIHDAGFEIYSQALAIRAGDLEELSPCLEQLVPIIQQSVVDYAANPERTNALIVDAVEQFEDFWVYSPGLAEYSVKTQRELGLIGNGPDDTVGNVDPDRVQGIIDQMSAAGLDVPEGLQAADIVTNEFIDESISLPEMATEEEESAAPAEEEMAAEEEMVALGDVCPDPIVIQTDWFPEAEHGALYEMVGDDYTVDTDTKVVRGSLIASGEDTGVDIEVRTGGPAIGFQNPIQQMYVETDIMLGYVSNDEAIFGAEDTPTLAVVAPLEKNPQIIMWDPETYPDVKTIADLGKTGATIQVFAGGTYIDVFINEGIVSADQIDPSYDGSPARWVAENGAVAQQGFASAEPYIYENEIEEWGKPVAFQLIHDAGLEIYSQPLAIRTGDLEELRPCLEQLVPIVQQAVVDYVASPDRANAIIVDAVEQYQDFWVYGPELAEYSVNAQVELGLVGNGPDGIVGNMDPARVQGVIDKMVAAGLNVPEGLKAEDIITNEFIDENIGLP